MKIGEHQAARHIVKISKNATAEAPAEKNSVAQKGDRVSFSPQARELIKAQKALAALPDIREDKVAEIKARIEEGRYHIDSEGIAAKMIRENFPAKD